MGHRNFHLLQLNDKDLGEILLAVIVPTLDDPWGDFAPLRETIWGSRIREVSGEAMAHARHGYALPLMREIGPEPQVLARGIPDVDGACSLIQTCILAKPSCRPGKHLPDCYEPKGEHSELIALVALAWKANRYVLVVKGEEFSLR